MQPVALTSYKGDGQDHVSDDFTYRKVGKRDGSRAAETQIVRQYRRRCRIDAQVQEIAFQLVLRPVPTKKAARPSWGEGGFAPGHVSKFPTFARSGSEPLFDDKSGGFELEERGSLEEALEFDA